MMKSKYFICAVVLVIIIAALIFFYYPRITNPNTPPSNNGNAEFKLVYNLTSGNTITKKFTGSIVLPAETFWSPKCTTPSCPAGGIILAGEANFSIQIPYNGTITTQTIAIQNVGSTIWQGSHYSNVFFDNGSNTTTNVTVGNATDQFFNHNRFQVTFQVNLTYTGYKN